MAEVKTSPSGHLGLFATEVYKTGDTILSELHPLLRLAPAYDEESARIQTEWSDDGSSSSATLWESIHVPDSIKSPGTFKGMVQAGMLWMKHASNDDETTRQKVLKLYFPDDNEKCSEEEKAVRILSEQATGYLKEHASNSRGKMYSTFDDWKTLQKVLLVWACNSFQGGRIYDTISRINHSCNPNAVVVTTVGNSNGQRIVAAREIAAGTEITISYLGLLLYADTATRRKKLVATKYFTCQCSRCKEIQEGAAQIPCPSYHPRHPTQMSLDEDVQYDDDNEVRYVSNGQKCKVRNNDPAGERLQRVLTSVATKIESFLETYASLHTRNGETKSSLDTAQDNDENDALLEEHLSLASTMMGRKHWTTNLMLLLHLDRRLSSMSKQMLTTQELPEMEEVAEAIDSLQRLYDYVDSLQLDLDHGHVLGDVTIGVARTLVSLGDRKSQKYGSEWLEKIDAYVVTFGDEGLQKVVAALKGAWKKHDQNGGDNDKQSKKLKVG